MKNLKEDLYLSTHFFQLEEQSNVARAEEKPCALFTKSFARKNYENLLFLKYETFVISWGQGAVCPRVY